MPRNDLGKILLNDDSKLKKKRKMKQQKRIQKKTWIRNI